MTFHATEMKELQRRIAVYDDEAAYKELFIIFYKPLLQFANSFVKSHEVAEEVVSDVFLHIWERRRQLEEIVNLKVYLYVSTKNTSLKYLLKQQRQVSITIDELSVELESPYHNPEQQLVTAELMNRVQTAINELPPRCKIIFRLIREDGLRYKEIAEILNVSVKTIDNQLAIALSKISRALNFSLKKSR
ncbi:MAG TPA: RNA polymerase sigma-70 factor [Chitinophaga sp.]|uniref:RNA polymerase sigma-70 factor n=1 Tax=Chitinophaga sp. TaxID=1869181 RepID=UPI002C42DEA2|nr:RNA polymerase sigma-70 factor [Chitinophaga sp.]HVI49513.1 RNA polymerase sigma-70 factor [Chitinophaga sp.]